MGDPLRDLVSGAMVMAYFVAGLFFLRFWRETADRLFQIFAIAFWMLALQRTLLSLYAWQPEAHVYLYGIRALAFGLIIVAILDKNRNVPAID
jgi:hypothetical protein